MQKHSMSKSTEEILHRLRKVVHGDPELQANLFALTEVDQFIAAVCQLAQTSGHELEHDKVRQAMYAGRKTWMDRKSM